MKDERAVSQLNTVQKERHFASLLLCTVNGKSLQLLEWIVLGTTGTEIGKTSVGETQRQTARLANDRGAQGEIQQEF